MLGQVELVCCMASAVGGCWLGIVSGGRDFCLALINSGGEWGLCCLWGCSGVGLPWLVGPFWAVGGGGLWAVSKVESSARAPHLRRLSC